MSREVIFDDNLESQFQDDDAKKILKRKKAYLIKLQNEYKDKPTEIKKIIINKTENDIKILSQDDGLRKYLEKFEDNN